MKFCEIERALRRSWGSVDALLDLRNNVVALDRFLISREIRWRNVKFKLLS